MYKKMEVNNTNSSVYNFEKIVDTIIRLGVLFFLISWCLDILRPFILILIWAIVIAVGIHPLYKSLVKLFRGKKILGAVFLTLLMLSILIAPSILVAQTLFAEIGHIRDTYMAGQPLIPPPGPSTANWPMITQPIVEIWQLASDNLAGAAIKYAEQIKVGATWLLAAFAGIGKGILQFVVSIIIAAFLLIYSEPLTDVSRDVFTKLVGQKGNHYAVITVATIRNVVKGFLGVALIQSIMIGVGFFMAGVPFAGFLTVGCLILAIIQVGVGPIAIPVVIYMFSVSDTTTATILAVWIAITLVSDNILKPILLGTGNPPAPMVVVFLGAIGGFIYNGFIGLFLGSVILTIGYKLFMGWVGYEKDEEIIE